ncbi:MAG: hypothetical protein HYT50_01475 [Candidatus Wildermuthbacteria bacterium]|nr:hypothetical protein [Candidatus Wildermuthbacteria bacterium]
MDRWDKNARILCTASLQQSSLSAVILSALAVDFLQTWKESCLSVRDENAEPWQLDDLDRLRDDATDQLTEIADGNTPVYTREIDQIMFDHGDEIEEAFDDAGFDKDEKWPCGWQAAAICTYINSELRRELDDWLDEEEDRIEEKESESS